MCDTCLCLSTCILTTLDLLKVSNMVTVEGSKLLHDINTFYNSNLLQPISRVPWWDMYKNVDKHLDINKGLFFNNFYKGLLWTVDSNTYS